MKRVSHVLILFSLILPMLVLVPSPATRTTGTDIQLGEAGESLPAQFVHEALRVAVYAEDNLSLPAYASGGVYTSNHAAIAELLEAAGYAVTEVTTQDILSHELRTRDFDVFVLPDQLPRESVVNHIRDFWLGGGGILSLHSALGFLYYYGMIVIGEEGNFALLGEDTTAHWGFGGVTNMTIGERHPVTKDYQAGDTIHLDEIGLIIDRMYIDSFNPGDYVDLLYETSDPVNALAFGLDNSARKGGRIVQIHGNYTVAPTWYTLMVDEAVDWLAPRPKGRILVDLSHSPWIALDPWDDWEEAYYLNQWRNGLVNRSYTVDKLATSLSADNLVGYDMLVVLAPIDNFTSPELTYVRNWVEAGGGLLAIGDHPTLAPVDMNLNYLLSPYNIQFSLGAGGTFDTYATPVLVHPTLEDTMWMEYDSFAYLNITGDAFPLWMDDANIACAGQEYGIGRIVVVPDLNLFTDTLGITNYDNFRFLMNVANWLTTATARVLLLNDEFISPDRNRVAPALALNTLGINYYITHDSAWLNVSLYDYWDNWDLVIADVPGGSLNGYFDDLQAYVEAGGKLIISYYQMNSYAGSPLWPFLGVLPVAYAGDQPDVYIWVSDSPVFNIPAEYGADLFRPTEDYGSEGSYLHVFSNATSLAGFSSSPTTNETVIALRNDGRALVNAFLIDEFQGDHDNSTYMDSYELWMDEIALLYFERPTIDHPADVTYVEGETGNSIVWTPNAPAGPWRYVLRVNGSIDAVVLWDGSPINVSIDGVDVSVTTYELTVYDDLGYYVSDSVMLDVTAYVPPPGLNPLLLVAIGAGAVILVVVVLMVTKRGKKE